MTILRSGPSKKYSNNWASAFGKKKETRKNTKKKAAKTSARKTKIKKKKK